MGEEKWVGETFFIEDFQSRKYMVDRLQYSPFIDEETETQI